MAIASLMELEKQLFSQDNGRSVIGELDNVTRLHIYNGTITTVPIGAIRYENVRKMRIYGDHDAEFPREGVRFDKKGHRPIVSVSTEEHPQILVAKGGLNPTYRVRDMAVDLKSRKGTGEIDGSTLRILSPADFSIHAEYISDEEAALLEFMRHARIIPGRISGATDGYFATLAGGSVLASLLAAVGYAISAASAAGPGIIYFISTSPNVTLTFPDGRVDADTGAQVMEFSGKAYSGKIETTHYGKESIGLPNFGVDGYFFVEGSGNFMLPSGKQRVYGGDVSGRLDYKPGRAFLVGNIA